MQLWHKSKTKFWKFTLLVYSTDKGVFLNRKKKKAIFCAIVSGYGPSLKTLSVSIQVECALALMIIQYWKAPLFL